MLKLKYFERYVIKRLAKKLDNLFCYYLGIHKEKLRLQSLRMKDNSMMVTYAIPFKRYLFKEPWNKLNIKDLIRSHSKINNKVGLAVGKSIAKGLVVSFEEAKIDSPKSE